MQSKHKPNMMIEIKQDNKQINKKNKNKITS